jgi:Uma2 family endonuclease
VALLFPEQGEWSVSEYLDLPGNRLIEFTNGYLEFLPMPTTTHQWIVLLFHQFLYQFVWPDLGLALFAPLRIRISKKKFREPDVAFMLNEHKDRIKDEYWTGADLAMEVVSPGKRHGSAISSKSQGTAPGQESANTGLSIQNGGRSRCSG